MQQYEIGHDQDPFKRPNVVVFAKIKIIQWLGRVWQRK